MDGSEQINPVDFSEDYDADRALSPVADQLVAIAEKLRTGQLSAALDDLVAVKETRADPPETKLGQKVRSLHELPSNRQAFAAKARIAYEIRRSRAAIFGDADLFGEPAWDILLDLYIAHSDGKSVSVSSACIGSAAPPTTGLRWLGVLTEQGLILREHDPDDQRRVLVRLSDKGLSAMDRYFTEAMERGAA